MAVRKQRPSGEDKCSVPTEYSSDAAVEAVLCAAEPSGTSSESSKDGSKPPGPSITAPEQMQSRDWLLQGQSGGGASS
jgi:hypothetical protein